VFSDHYGFSCHGASSLTRGRVYLVLVVLSLSVVTIQNIKLFIIYTICNMYNIRNMYKTRYQSRPLSTDYTVSVLPYFIMTA
jgi:hypothetical protein